MFHQSDLDRDLAVGVQYFVELQVGQVTPLMYAFPANSCELASALMASALSTKYKDSLVLRAKGVNPKNSEVHFWVQVGETILDPTAHQFAHYTSPLICRAPSPLQTIFSEIEYVCPSDAIDELNAPNAERRINLLEELSRRIGTYAHKQF